VSWDTYGLVSNSHNLPKITFYGKLSETRCQGVIEMPKPRKPLVLLDEASYHHCISLCVHLAFLCTVDSPTCKNYERQRQWIIQRMKHIAGVFASELIIKWLRRLLKIISLNFGRVDTEVQSLQMDRLVLPIGESHNLQGGFYNEILKDSI
jgi:hypothetical protein